MSEGKPRFEPDESGLTGGYIYTPGSEEVFSGRQLEQGGRILDLTLDGELIGVELLDPGEVTPPQSQEELDKARREREAFEEDWRIHARGIEHE